MQKNLTRADLNCKCHAPRTDDFTSPPKDAVQDAPTHCVEKLSGLLTAVEEDCSAFTS